MGTSESGPTLVFHAGALGDTVITWPLLRELGPATFVAARHHARLTARCLPNIDAVDGEAPDFSRLFAPAAHHEVSDDLRRLFRSARRVISFISNGQDVWAKNLRALAPEATHAFVPTRPPTDWNRPACEWHRQALQDALQQEFELIDPARRLVPDGPVVIHPGSGGADKCWPAERFDALLEHLQHVGRMSMVVLGEAERTRIPTHWIDRWRDRYDVVEPATLTELAEHLGRAAVFVGNDAGPTHLAAQLGIPTVALFGPTNVRCWRPRGPAVTVIAPPQPAPMTWLPLETVIHATARF